MVSRGDGELPEGQLAHHQHRLPCANALANARTDAITNTANAFANTRTNACANTRPTVW
jgi:hypothetical protein